MIQDIGNSGYWDSGYWDSGYCTFREMVQFGILGIRDIGIQEIDFGKMSIRENGIREIVLRII